MASRTIASITITMYITAFVAAGLMVATARPLEKMEEPKSIKFERIEEYLDIFNERYLIVSESEETWNIIRWLPDPINEDLGSPVMFTKKNEEHGYYYVLSIPEVLNHHQNLTISIMKEDEYKKELDGKECNRTKFYLKQTAFTGEDNYIGNCDGEYLAVKDDEGIKAFTFVSDIKQASSVTFQ